MRFDKTLASIVLAPLVGLCLPLMVFYWKKPAVKLIPAEKEMISFNYQPASVRLPGMCTLDAATQSPVKPGAPGTTTGQAAAPGQPAPPDPRTLSGRQPTVPGPRPHLSMIYQDGPVRRAIINGQVTREGTPLGAYRVTRIESDRVLLKADGKELWITMD